MEASVFHVMNNSDLAVNRGSIMYHHNTENNSSPVLSRLPPGHSHVSSSTRGALSST